MNTKLKQIIKDNWDVSYEQLSADTRLINLAEDIACKSESCTVEEAYGMFIDNPNLHLPGLICVYIIDEMGLDTKNTNAGMTLGQLFTP